MAQTRATAPSRKKHNPVCDPILRGLGHHAKPLRKRHVNHDQGDWVSVRVITSSLNKVPDRLQAPISLTAPLTLSPTPVSSGCGSKASLTSADPRLPPASSRPHPRLRTRDRNGNSRELKRLALECSVRGSNRGRGGGRGQGAGVGGGRGRRREERGGAKNQKREARIPGFCDFGLRFQQGSRLGLSSVAPTTHRHAYRPEEPWPCRNSASPAVSQPRTLLGSPPPPLPEEPRHSLPPPLRLRTRAAAGPLEARSLEGWAVLTARRGPSVRVAACGRCFSEGNECGRAGFCGPDRGWVEPGTSGYFAIPPG